ncbi:hypothetical protein [Noviherbaspirillum soli]|uniref:hypothetical protein n=1 Tax=Noviherbaspirillum soli TaxID=1064518 RepID=UPI00188B8E88|nr:hypothetical protein [Noviherbaspirillum soli]
MLYGALLFLAFSVAACGGSGSGSSPSPSSSAGDSASTPKNLPAVQSVIDQSNYVNTAAHAYLAPDSLGGITRLNDMFLSGVSVNTKVPGLTELATDVLRQLVGKQASTVTAVVESASCPGGGTAKVSSSGDSLDDMKPGDVISLEASNCGVSGLKVNGGLMLALKEGSVVPVPNGASQSVMQFQFSSLSVASETETALIDGDVTVKYGQSSAGDITVVMSGDALRTMLKRDGALVTDRTLFGFESAATTTIAKHTTSGNYTLSASSPSVRDLHVGVKTVTPFVYGADINPVSGSMLVTGASSSVTITAVDAASVRLDLSARGDGVITESRTVSWPEFEKSF